VSYWITPVITPRHQASPVALDLVKRFEGCRLEAVRLPDGRCTIGYGHTRTAREGARISEDDAEALLTYDLRQIAAAIDSAVFTPLSQNHFDALVAFTFNIGVDNFMHSAVLRRINEGKLIQAAFALEIWRKADFDGERIVVDALVRRRAAEKALFLTPDGGWIPAPSAQIEPKPDFGLSIHAPDAPPTSADDRAIIPAGAAEHDLSPVERAATHLARRMQTLARDEPRAPPPPLQVDELTGETAPFLDDSVPEREPTLAAPRETQPTALDVESLRRTIFGAPEPRPPLAPSAWRPLALLGGAGLAVFIGAVIWAFHAEPTGRSIMPLNIGVVIVGFIGIMAAAGAVYLLLEKLAARDL
jgi:lysozyme